MIESEKKYQINGLATHISIAAIDLFVKYDPTFFESKKSELFCERLQEVIRKVMAEFLDEQEKH